MSVMGWFQLGTGQAAYGGGEAGSSAIDVTVGFKPIYVKVFNLDSSNQDFFELIRGDDDTDMGEGMKFDVDTGDVSELSTNGITLNEDGFTIGTECTTNSEDYMWMAFG